MTSSYIWGNDWPINNEVHLEKSSASARSPRDQNDGSRIWAQSTDQEKGSFKIVNDPVRSKVIIMASDQWHGRTLLYILLAFPLDANDFGSSTMTYFRTRREQLTGLVLIMYLNTWLAWLGVRVGNSRAKTGLCRYSLKNQEPDMYNLLRPVAGNFRSIIVHGCTVAVLSEIPMARARNKSLMTVSTIAKKEGCTTWSTESIRLRVHMTKRRPLHFTLPHRALIQRLRLQSRPSMAWCISLIRLLK